MPDLVTHFAVSRIAVTPLRDKWMVLLVLLGTALPDLLGKGLDVAIDATRFTATPTHSLAGILVAAYLGAFFVEQRIRPAACLALFLGQALHLVLDCMKSTLLGGQALLFPFVSTHYEAGLFRSEESLYAMPVALIVLLLYWRKDRV